MPKQQKQQQGQDDDDNDKDITIQLRRSTRTPKPILVNVGTKIRIDDSDDDNDDDDDEHMNIPNNKNDNDEEEEEIEKYPMKSSRKRSSSSNTKQNNSSSSNNDNNKKNNNNDDDDSDIDDMEVDDNHDDSDNSDSDSERDDPSFIGNGNMKTSSSSSRNNNTKSSSSSTTTTTTTIIQTITPPQSRKVSNNNKTKKTKTKKTMKIVSTSKNNSNHSNNNNMNIITIAKKVMNSNNNNNNSKTNHSHYATTTSSSSIYMSIVQALSTMNPKNNSTSNNNNNTKKNKGPTTTSITDTTSLSFGSIPSSSQYTDMIHTIVQTFWNDMTSTTTSSRQQQQQSKSKKGSTTTTTNDDQDVSSNRIMVHLYNMIFQSVAGSGCGNGSNTNYSGTTTTSTNDTTYQLLLDPKSCIVEDMMDDDWTNHIDQMVEYMSHPEQMIYDGITIRTKQQISSLLPKSTANSSTNNDYYTIYTEFWYHLTMTILTNTTNENDDDEESDNQQQEQPFLPMELIRDIISRFIELMNVGVPDLRYAFCIAIYQMGYTLLQYTRTIQSKLHIAQRQYTVTKQNKQKQKLEYYEYQIQQYTNSMKDCEDIVKELIITTVFTIRYKDTDPTIRCISLLYLTYYCFCRPDLFLISVYLKYYGWMLSDKHPNVRCMALYGLFYPLQQQVLLKQRDVTLSKPKKGQQRSTTIHNNVDVTTNMNSVITKFLPRIIDCVIDIDTSVQEMAMEFILLLLRHYDDYMNDIDDDTVWNQLNLRALDIQTTPIVRKYALYIVLEQLDVFDTMTTTTTTTKTNRVPSEQDIVTQLYAIGKWVAHTLSDGKIPLSEIRYDLVDTIVVSLREMPEYKEYVTQNWNAMLRCILHGGGDEHQLQSSSSRSSSNSKKNSGSAKRGESRLNIVTQRVMIRMLVTAVQLEVMNSSNNGKDQSMTIVDDCDIELLEAERNEMIGSTDNQHQKTATMSITMKKAMAANKQKSHEELTMTLLRELPQLLVVFKSESSILQSLTTLPQFFLPSTINLPSRKKDVETLLSSLSLIYQESTDRIVLQNSIHSMVFCAKACVARSDMAILAMNKVWDSSLARLKSLFNKQQSKNHDSDRDDDDNDDDDDDDDNITKSIDVENSIRLCLLRLSILIKRWPFMGRSSDDSESRDNEREEVVLLVIKYLTEALLSRQCNVENDGDEIMEIPSIWSSVDDSIHQIVEKSVEYGFDFLTAVLSWRVLDEVQHMDKGDDDHLDAEDIENHIILRMRRPIEKLINLCFEQFLPITAMERCTAAHQNFSYKVQEHALHASGDIRTLFPRKWSQARSPLLQAFAILDDHVMAGGGVRFIRSQEWRLRDHPQDSMMVKQQKQDAMYNLLLPLARALGTNWETGSRKEAGVTLLHIAGSGKESSELVQCILRVMKKINPVRLLEAQMACLRHAFEEWATSDPEELGDRPTDAELQAFEEQEQSQRERFDSLVSMAARFSSALGVGKIRDKVLNLALLGFVREGVRFAFSTEEKGSDIPLPLGCRLIFLSIVMKYLTWIRQNKEHKAVLTKDINAYEVKLRRHDEYGDIFEEDLKCLADFRKHGELGDYVDLDGNTGPIEKRRGDASTTVGPSMLRARTSLGSSVSSIMSKESGIDSIEEDDPVDKIDDHSSVRSDTSRSLPSIPEKDDMDEDDDDENENDTDETTDDSRHTTPSPHKRPRMMSSARTQSSVASSIGPVFSTDTEDESDNVSSSM